MAYKEPNVYVTQVNTRPTNAAGPQLTPLIVGPGPSFIDFQNVSVARGYSGLTDVLPSTKVTAIVSVSRLRSSGTSTPVATSNFTFTAPNSLTWSGGGTDVPVQGNAPLPIANSTQVAAPTAAPTLALATGTTAFTVGQNFYVVYTWTNANGETIKSPEGTVAIVTAGQQINVTIPALPTGATNARIYVSTATGTETFGGTTATTSYSITALPTAGAAVPPLANTTQQLPPTLAPTLTSSGTSGTLLNTTYFVKYTWTTTTGETTPSPEAYYTLNVGTTSLSVTVPMAPSTVVTQAKVYVGTTSNGELFNITSTVTTTASSVVVVTAPSVASEVYYVSYEARPETAQYVINTVTSFSQLASLYSGAGTSTSTSGAMFMKTSSLGAYNMLNKVYLGAYLALEAGASAVKVLQVQPADTINYVVVDALDFATSLANQAAYDSDVYRIVPMTLDSTAIGSIVTHVNTYSVPAERKERTCFISKNILSTTKSAMINEVTSFAQSYANKRVSYVWPDQATKVLSDGNTYNLDGTYICAALAGLDSVLPVSRSLTRSRLLNFVKIGWSQNQQFLRADLNAIAGAGVLIMEQPAGTGTPAQVRQALTSDMSSSANSENSVVKVGDFTAKYLRQVFSPYIGVYNINGDLLARMQQSANAAFDTLTRLKVINSGIVVSIAQDQTTPTNMIVSISITAPFPVNTMDVTLFVG